MSSRPPRVEAARALALRAHADQRYGPHPYAWHLERVAALCAPFGEDAEVAAWLHDTVEDTPLSVEEIAEAFGPGVAAVVDLVTDAPGPTRSQRKAATYARFSQIAQASPEALALVVKAADRLANVRACIEDGEARLLGVYRAEHAALAAAARRPGLAEPLWAELDALLGA